MCAYVRFLNLGQKQRDILVIYFPVWEIPQSQSASLTSSHKWSLFTGETSRQVKNVPPKTGEQPASRGTYRYS